MSQALFLLPDDSMLDYTREVLAAAHADITVAKGFGYEAIPIVETFLSIGGEVVIARGGTAKIIRNAFNTNVVEVPITGFDIIRAVEEARQYGSQIAVVASYKMIEGIEYLAPILGVSLTQYFMEDPDEAEGQVKKAIVDRANVVLGGVAATKAAKKLGLPFVHIRISRESILTAVQESTYVLHALRIEKAKRNMLNTVLDYAYEGILVVDQKNIVTEFNPAAERLTKTSREKILGQNVTQLLPDLQLEKVTRTGKDDLHFLLNVQGQNVLCNKVPIRLNDTVIGAVATMQDVTKIQEMEARIRQEYYSKGHVARFSFKDILGTSPSMEKAVNAAKSYAQTESNILILGETGTGKEVFAQSIHHASSRKKGPFVAINCAALPAHLLESELFGYVAGAFTGATKTGKPGLFEIAHCGTIFLDEISEMDYLNQGRLLRVLQEKTVMRLGSDKVLPIDVRIIAATNKDLKKMVSENKFRDDLYFRLNVLRLQLPPLRQRTKDIAGLVEHFLYQYGLATGKKLSVTTKGISLLQDYAWPGNVRELQNVLERAIAITPSGFIDHVTLQQTCGDDYAFSEQDPADRPDHGAEIKKIIDALAMSNGRLAEASTLLGIDRTTLWRKMRKLNIDKSHSKKNDAFD